MALTNLLSAVGRMIVLFGKVKTLTVNEGLGPSMRL